jgi:hypothetical protein
MKMRALRAFLTGKRLLVILIGVALWSVAVFLLDPSARVGPLGLGLPARWTGLEVTVAGLCVSHPDSWVGFETPQGSHGDLAVVAAIGVPGRSWPAIKILAGGADGTSVSALVAWAGQRARQHAGYSTLDTQQLVPPGWDGQTSEYVFTASGLLGPTQIRCYDFSIMAATGGYVLTMCAETEDWQVVQPVFRDIIDTLSPTSSGGSLCTE